MAVTVSYSLDGIRVLDLNDFTTTGPEVISLANGGFAATGDHNDHTDGVIFNPNAYVVTTFNDGGSSNGTNAALAQLTNGNIVQVSQDADSILYEVRNSSTGAIVVASTDINDTASTNADVAALTGGGFVVANQQHFGVGTDNDIELRYYNNLGVIQGSVHVVDNSTADDQNVSIAGLSNGGVVAAWTRTTGTDTAIMYAIYDSGGSVVLAPTTLDGIGTLNDHASVVALAGGGFAVAYEDNGWGYGTNDITVGIYSATGAYINEANITDPAGVNDGSNDETPYIAQISNGMLVVAYGDNTTADTDTKVILLDSNLNVLAERFVEHTTNDTIATAVAAYGSGQLAAFFSAGGDNAGAALQASRQSTGDGAANTINGDSLRDFINGAGGADHINGLDGNDVLRGALGDDVISGGRGPDQIYGAQGHDTLTGGLGNDKFVFNIAPNANDSDHITDFLHAADEILLDNSVFAVGANGALNPNAFFSGANAHDTSDRIIYNPTNGNLFYDPDGSGSGAKILIAVLDNHPASIDAGDFRVI